MQNKALSVSEATRYIKQLVEKDITLSRLFVTGEISSLKHYKIGGQLYFTLKDQRCQMNCVVFENVASKLKFVIENGMKVNVIGRISVFEKRGQYNLQVFAIEPLGIGPLALAFEQIKQKLEGEGLFALDRKRPIPKFPESIGIIASPSGAALWDIVTVARRRAPYAKIYLYPSIVQGDNAPPSIINAVKLANQHQKVDILLLSRGGGSMEDLFCFNDEALAYAVAESKIPTVSAVGHEVDFTICDFVADMRSPTPSAAAEMLFVDKDVIDTRLETYTKELEQKINCLTEDTRLLLDNYVMTLNGALKDKYKDAQNQLNNLVGRLEALNPLALFNKGYSVSMFGEKVLKSIKDCQLGDKITTRLSDGEIKAQVYQINSLK